MAGYGKFNMDDESFGRLLDAKNKGRNLYLAW